MSFAFATGAVGLYLLVAAVLLRTLSAAPAAVVVFSALAAYPAGLLAPLLFGSKVSFFEFSAAYWCLISLFLLAFGAIHKSISLRILIDLLDQPGYSAPHDKILARYIKEDSFQHRLEVMRRAGFAAFRGGTVELTVAGRRLAALVRSVQILYAIEKSG